MGRRGKRGHGGPKGKGQSGGSHDKKKPGDPVDGSVVVKGKGGSTTPVHGLSNLGNTCFFNAVMQCIGQSHYFKARLEAHIQSPKFTCQLKLLSLTDSTGSEDKVCRTVTVQEKPGELTVKLNTFLNAMGEGGGGTLNPKPVFSEICKKAPRFSGYHQQDSQELLRYLLDSLRSEEVYRIKKALLLTYNVSSGKAKVTEEDRREIRLYGIQAQLAETFVDDVFGGRLVSSVVCLECGNSSTIHETFLDLSLPIADDKGTNQQSSKDHKRNKSGKQAATVSRGVASENSEREASPPLPVEKTLSKYQLKKAKKQQEKAARKEAKSKAKKQQSLKLQEFLNTPSKENAENEQPQSGVKEGGEEEETGKMEEGEPATQELKTEGEGGTSVNSLVGGRDTEGETNSQGVKVEGEMNIDDLASHSQPASTDSTEPADICASPSEEDQNIDPATGECKVVTMDTEEQSNTTETGDTTMQGYTFTDYASAGPLPDQRDTTGPLEDNTSNETERPTSEIGEGEEGGGNKREDREITKLLGEVTPKEKNKEDNEITELLGAITLDEKEPPATASAMVEEGEEEGGEKREDSQLANLSVDLNSISTDAVLERLKVQIDSVEGSLKRFCTPELLTGSNKFACAVCTRERAGKETALEQEEGKIKTKERQKGEDKDVVNIEVEEGEEGQAEMEIKGKDQAKDTVLHESQEETENDVQEPTTAESIPVIDKTPSEVEGGGEGSVVSPQSPPSSDGEEEHRPGGTVVSQLPNEELPPSSVLPKQGDPSSSTAHEEKLLSGNGQDELPLLGEKDAKDGEEETPVKEQEKDEVVFSDAKKQFLIESLPLILTLNLKRFVQHGRRLQKNSRHISFPTLLDVAPFCTNSCKVGRCDSKGQLLYSLYGVVEHSGGMQGGHYTAYVRTRTPIKLNSSKMTPKEQHHQAIPHQEQRPPEESVGEGAGERGSGASVLGGSDFDVSSSAGQWYYISDSRVRTATESEVFKSQAYLLFYEQLPLLSE